MEATFSLPMAAWGRLQFKKIHIKAYARRRKIFIPSVTLLDTTSVDQSCKVQAFWNHFNDLIGTYKPCTSSINLSSLNFPSVQLNTLAVPISTDEVKATIFYLHPEKAPGPDGFTGLFYRLACDTIKDDVMLAMQKLEASGSQGLQILNNALLILLPKIPEASRPSEFRPISLVHSFGKIFTKIMATRL